MNSSTTPEREKESPLTPTASLLVKLGSIIVHYQEAISPTGHHFDKAALDGLMNDQEVKEWLKSMDSLSLLPKKR